MTAAVHEHGHDAKRPRLADTPSAMQPSNDGDDGAEAMPPKQDIGQDTELRAILDSDYLPSSTHSINFRKGLFLAPMVRIGSLPTRLLSLQYGADLVWSPEIVDRAIIGCERIVDDKTGKVAFVREGKEILTTHSIERDRLIFQLGSSSPEWAYRAISLVTANDDVAGVDLNCGCPKPFSTIGGMGAQLLGTPDLLCSILLAMRKAAPAHVSVTCKIRLLPTKEATQSLVRQIIRTGVIDALTVHCRTKDMRPREKALTSRFEEVRQVIADETGGKLPLICNGDAWDAEEACRMMKATGVQAIMIARGAEGNPSCFHTQGVVSIPEVIAPAWIRLALTFGNNYGNTKYCINSMAFKPSSSIVPNARPLRTSGWNKHKFQEARMKLSQAKTVEEMGIALGVDVQGQKEKTIDEALKEVREALQTRYDKQGIRVEGGYVPASKGTASDSGNEMADTEIREVGVNVV